MPTVSVGATWKKWDLHVHTPESFVHHYPGTAEEAWAAFLDDLEALPPAFKVIGINDYVLVDGYEKVLQAKQAGRLANIDLILPVVELRLDKFGGTVRGGAEAGRAAAWSRVNVHVIFDQVEPDFIRHQFISAIAPHYQLQPDAAVGSWGAVANRQTIEELGRAIIAASPAAEHGRFGSPLHEGFNNLNVGWTQLREVLTREVLRGKYLLAIGKTEWADLKWNDHTIADKKTIINAADLVFTAAESPQAYAAARASLQEAGVNAQLLDCSDAHWLSNATDKDRVGHCYTWIKADATFQGLVQAVQEFDGRVFVGEQPPKQLLVDRNRTKFIRSVKVFRNADSKLEDVWFDLDIPLNADLVAIIGNKGSGKSALSDAIALAGSSRNHGAFSFLNAVRFRHPRSRLAEHFTARIDWMDDTTSELSLDKNPERTSVERVKYLPQRYLEDLCNELGEGGSGTFDGELRKIIYSHVADDDKVKLTSMDELIDFRVNEFNQQRVTLRARLSAINIDIVDVERRLDSEYRQGLEQRLAGRRAELAALDMARPADVPDPSAAPEVMQESREAAALIEGFESSLRLLITEENELKAERARTTSDRELGRRVLQALVNQKEQCDTFRRDLKALTSAMSQSLAVEDLFNVQFNLEPVRAAIRAADHTVAYLEGALSSDDEASVASRRRALTLASVEAKARLGERERKFIEFKEALQSWATTRAAIEGPAERQGTIAALTTEIAGLAELPDKLKRLRDDRRSVARLIHQQLRGMATEYERLYRPVQEFVRSAEQMEMSIPLAFQVRIEETGFQNDFLQRINRQSTGSFQGVGPGGRVLQRMLLESSFESAEGAVAFADAIDHALHHYQREDGEERAAKVDRQLRGDADVAALMDYVFGFDYLSPRYSLTYDEQDIGQLSPGERGLLLLLFYLLVDMDDMPLVIDQPEENLDNQTIYKTLVKCIKQAKHRRQVIMVTHNPNLAVVCDAEQIIHASRTRRVNRFVYEAGAIENPTIRRRVVEILEGTEPAFKNRQAKYKLR